jgi:hypothetical protein
MSSSLSAAEFQRILTADAETRLDYAVSRWRGGGEVWTVADGEALMLLGDEDSPPLLVVWPQDEFALVWGEQTDLGDVELVAIENESFRESTLSELADAGITLRVFPTPQDEGRDISAAELQTLLS